MKYRQLSPTGDYSFGGGAYFLTNTPEAVAQAIKTRMGLLAGEWFLDTKEGLDVTKILGVGTQTTRDFEVQSRILGTPGVKSLLNYSSAAGSDRTFMVSATVDTIYGVITFTRNF
jgi:hypothetical protein